MAVFVTARTQAADDRRQHDRDAAEASRRKFEPDPQRIAAQVIAEIPPSQTCFDPKTDMERYARVIAVECMRRLKIGSAM